jgi:outer membrane protein OmpA-like peptidoglycan-associated protein
MNSDNGRSPWPMLTEETEMTDRSVRTIAITLGTIATLLAGSAFAESRSSREEAAGVGAGATIGAVAGGPVGLIIGAAAGAWLGDQFHAKKQQVEGLSMSLDEAEMQLGGLATKIADLQSEQRKSDGEIARLRAIAKPELLSLLQSGIEMDLLFRTDEHVLADSTGHRLQQLADTLATMPDVRIQLDGFADERGDADYNRELSTRRAYYVRDVLISAGVIPSRIKVEAHGESPAIDNSADSYALDRRVSLTLYVEGNPSFASNPD